MSPEKSWRTRDIDSLPAFVQALAEEIHYLGTYGGKLPRSQNRQRIDSNRGISQVGQGEFFNKYIFGTFRNTPGANFFQLYTPTEPVLLCQIIPFGVGGNVYTLGICPTGSNGFNVTPTPIETVPATGVRIDSDKILVWNTNTSSASLQKIFETKGPGKLISVGESLCLQNLSGSLMTFNVMLEFQRV
jgi:hypothetical protein